MTEREKEKGTEYLEARKKQIHELVAEGKIVAEEIVRWLKEKGVSDFVADMAITELYTAMIKRNIAESYPTRSEEEIHRKRVEKDRELAAVISERVNLEDRKKKLQEAILELIDEFSEFAERSAIRAMMM